MFGDFIAQYLISALKRYMRYCFSYMLVKFSSVRTIRDSGSITPPPHCPFFTDETERTQ